MVSTSLVLLPGGAQEVHRTPNTGNVSPSVHAENTPKVEDNPPLPSVFNLFRKVSLCRHLVRQDDLLFPIPGTVRASSLSLPLYFSTFRSPISIYAARFSKCIYASLVGVKERGSPVVIHEEPLDEVMCPSRYSPYNMFSMLLALQAWCFFCFHFLVLLFWASMRTAVSCTIGRQKARGVR